MSFGGKLFHTIEALQVKKAGAEFKLINYMCWVVLNQGPTCAALENFYPLLPS
jgi:hypothetical protein